MLTASEIANQQIDARAPAFASDVPQQDDEQLGQLWRVYEFCLHTERPVWESAGVWCPYVAAVCREAGVTPQQVGERVHPDFVRLVCDGSRRARDLVEAAR